MIISKKKFEMEMNKARDEVYEHVNREQQYVRLQERVWELEERVFKLENKRLIRRRQVNTPIR